MDIKVLGTGCANCRTTIALIEQAALPPGVFPGDGRDDELRHDLRHQAKFVETP